MSTLQSLLPGHLVSGLITAITPSGLNLKVLGFYNATIDQTHIGITDSDAIEAKYKVGKKVKGRIIFDYDSAGSIDEASGLNAGKVFGMSLLPHIVDLTSPQVSDGTTEAKKGKGKGKEAAVKANESASIEEAITIGNIMENVVVEKVEKEWGLICKTEAGYTAFVHVSDQFPGSVGVGK